jgi:transcriptional regulator with XRE-family HTH domain
VKPTEGQKVNAAVMRILREECEAQGVSFESLGQKAKVDRSTVSRSLRGERNPSLWVAYDMAAALGLSQLARLDDFNARRRALCSLYRPQLASIEHVLPLASPDYPHLHAHHLMIVRLDITTTGMSLPPIWSKHGV